LLTKPTQQTKNGFDCMKKIDYFLEAPEVNVISGKSEEAK
jgi:hypothetical protein